MSKFKYFVNLTNGIESIPNLERNSIKYSFIRIQSTACEQHLWDNIILDLDYNFLMSVALGYNCMIIDYGANKMTPRSIYQGVEFIRYVLWKHWYGCETVPFVKGHDCQEYFNKCYYGLSEKAKKKLDYFKPYLQNFTINIRSYSYATTHDGDKKYYNEILKKVNSK